MGQMVLTKTGKRKRVSYDTVATWVSESWKDISADLVVKAMAANGRTFDENPPFHSRLAKLLNTVGGIEETISVDEDEDPYALLDDSNNDDNNTTDSSSTADSMDSVTVGELVADIDEDDGDDNDSNASMSLLDNEISLPQVFSDDSSGDEDIHIEPKKSINCTDFKNFLVEKKSRKY